MQIDTEMIHMNVTEKNTSTDLNANENLYKQMRHTTNHHQRAEDRVVCLPEHRGHS